MGMITAGIIALGIGWLWGMTFPMNKALWTSSFVVWTAGFALLTYSVCYWLVEIKQWKKYFKPLELFGTYAMAAFVLHVVFAITQVKLFVKTSTGKLINLRPFITEHLFGWSTVQHASLYYGIACTLFWLLMLSLYNKTKYNKTNT